MSVTEKTFRTFAVIAAIIALIGIGDAVYLTYKHYTAMPVPCTITEGCETVLTSSYAKIGEIPLAVFGLAAYISAFVLAVLSVFGNRATWYLFVAQTVVMAAFSVWLLYLQAFVIKAFCQFCLLSAATSFALFLTAILSLFRRPKTVKS